VITWARAVSEGGAGVVLAQRPRTGATLADERYTGYGLPRAVAAALMLVAVTRYDLYGNSGPGDPDGSVADCAA
jgi:ABC-type sulfate transport system permease component